MDNLPSIDQPPSPPNGYTCRKILLTTINVIFILVVLQLIILQILYNFPPGPPDIPETVFLYAALWLSLPLNIVGIVGVHCSSLTCLGVYFSVHALATAAETVYLVFTCLYGSRAFSLRLLLRPPALVVTVVGHFAWSMIAFAALQDLYTITRQKEEYEEKKRAAAGSSSFKMILKK